MNREEKLQIVREHLQENFMRIHREVSETNRHAMELMDKARSKGAKYDKLYLDWAKRIAEESKCPRLHVGCVVVAESGMIAPGFNGHASGGPNEWADDGVFNPEVVHAELNALGKMLEQGVSAKGATVYLTHSSCPDCAKLLVRAKVARVVYIHEYRLSAGVDYLRKYGIQVEKYEEEEDVIQ